MRWMALIVTVLLSGCAGIMADSPRFDTASWTPPSGRTELQVKRDYSECNRRGVSSTDMCLQSLGYSKK